MATIRNSISLTDQMSPTLRKIMKAMDSTLRVMQQVDKQMSGGKQSKAYQQAARDIQNASNAIKKFGNYSVMAFNQANAGASKLSQYLNAVSSAATRAQSNLAKMNNVPMNWGKSLMNSARNSPSLFGSLMKGSAGSLLYGIGGIGKGVGTIIPAFSKVITASNAMATSFVKNTKNMWSNFASGIYIAQNVAAALGSVTRVMDQATSDMARLQLFNYSGTTSSQAYGMVYQAAQRSRSDLTATSQLTSRIAMSGVFGQQEGSLEASARVAETINKALVLSGGTDAENQRAILQLSQGLSSGVLQGDELRSIREQSPYLAQMIAEGLALVDPKFEGTTIGDLKELGAQGVLTSDIVIKALMAVQDQVDATFDENAPRTWSQGVTALTNTIQYLMGVLSKMENGPLSALSEIIWNINDWLNSEGGMSFLSAMAAALYVVGNVLNWIISLVLSIVGAVTSNAPVMIGLITLLGVVFAIMGYQALSSALIAAAGWAIMNWQLLLIIGIIVLIIYILNQLGISTAQILGFIGGLIAALGAFVINTVIGLINAIIQYLWSMFVQPFISIIEWILNVCNGGFDSFGGAVANLIGNIISWFLSLGKVVTKIIDAIFGTDWTSGLESLQTEVEAWGKTENSITLDRTAPTIDYRIGYEDAWNSGYDFGSGLGSILDGGLGIDGLLGEGVGGLGSIEDMLGNGIPVNGGDLDSVGAINSDVDISDEDLQLMRDMAAREFMLNLQTVTPTANITFGDVRETADAKQILGVIEQMVEEQLATSLVS